MKVRRRRNKEYSPLLRIIIFLVCIIGILIMLNYLVNKNNMNKIINNTKEISNIFVSRDSLKIKVINCTKIKNLAALTQEELNKKGYTKVDIDNGQEVEKTKVLVREENAKPLIKSDFNFDNFTKEISNGIDKEKYYDVIILLGKDYKKIGEIK